MGRANSIKGDNCSLRSWPLSSHRSLSFALFIERCAAIVFLLILFIYLFVLEKKNEAGEGGGKLSTQLSRDVQGDGEGLFV